MSVLLGPAIEPIPGYRLIERLGRGGFGEVWKAEAPGGLHKAIKFVYGDLSAASEGEPAEQELKSLERVKTIRHPYILSLERFEVVEGQLLIVMELADRNLWDRFRDCRAQGLPGIPREELLRYLEEAAEALDLMNLQYQLQHLDIKPQNLFLVHNHIKVADFGLVKDFEGKRGTITGGVTPVYAAPETFEGWVSRQSDQYSLGIVYQELLTGQRPFNGSTARQLLLQHLQTEPDVSPLPESDRAIVARSLAKKPDDRYPTCTELIRSLREAGGGAMRVLSTPAAGVHTMPIAAPAHHQSVVATPTQALSPTDYDRHPVSILPRHGPFSEPPLTQARLAPQATDAEPNLVPLPLPESSSSDSPDKRQGCLTPAVVLGLGGFGAKVLQHLRAAIRSQLTTEPVPHLRMLAIDTDADSLRKLTSDRNNPLGPDEVFHAGLNRPSHYLKGDVTGSIESWLGPQMLYKLPRNAAPAGLRGFGRLALCDHAAKLSRRIKAELDACRTAAALDASDHATGLGIRTDKPRVYVVAGLGGGTGGGMFIDLAYLVRHLFRQYSDLNPNVIGMFLLPSAERSTGQANSNLNMCQAALIELNHFSAAKTRYEFRFDSKTVVGPDQNRPFQHCWLMPLPNDNGESAIDVATGQSAAVLFRELLTPLGPAAERERQVVADVSPVNGIDAQTAATHRIAWPASGMRRCAGRELALATLREWTSRESEVFKAPVSQWLDEQWDLRALSAERIAERFHQAATEAIGMTPQDKIESLIAPLAETARLGAQIDSITACEVLEQIIRILGYTDGFEGNNKPKVIPELFEKYAPVFAKECDQVVAELAIHFVEQPIYRIRGAEEAVRQIGERARQALTSYEGLQITLRDEAKEQFQKVFPMIGMLDRIKIRSKRKDQLTQDIIALLRDYPKKLYQSILSKYLVGVYRGILGGITEFLHEVNQCRVRLSAVERVLVDRASKEPEFDPALGPGRHLLPDGQTSLGVAAKRMVDQLTDPDREEFDRTVQTRVQSQYTSLLNYCLDAGPNAESMAEVLENTAEEFIGARLGRHTSVDLLMQEHDEDDVGEIMQKAFEAAHPPLAGPRSKIETMVTIIATPDTPSGRELRGAARKTLLDEPISTANSADEILVYRELRRLSLADLPHFSPAARTAFQKAASEVENPIFSRVDLNWLPVK